jgi:copper resistance protein C
MKHLLFAVSFAACACAATGAWAHAFLDHAIPAVGSSVPTAPRVVTMWFTEELEPVFTTAVVTNQSGNQVSAGPAQIDPKNRTELQVPLRPLPPGTYTVTWHALSVDTHTTEGHWTFQVGGG